MKRLWVAVLWVAILLLASWAVVRAQLPLPGGASLGGGGGGGAVSSVFGRTGAVTAQTNDYTATQVGLGSVTNNAQTRAAIVPNTAPAAGQVLVGNAGGTAYAPVSFSADCTMASTGAITCTETNGTAFGSLATLSSTFLCTSWVVTSQSTTSTTYGDLTTADSCTFSLGATTTVVIRYQADTELVSTSGTSCSIVVVDSTAASNDDSCVYISAGTGHAAAVAQYQVSLSSGSHTIDIQHKLLAGNATVSWAARLLTVSF